MTHDAATIAGINRRIAEYDGWTKHCPDYWRSTDEIMLLVECLCLERKAEFSTSFARRPLVAGTPTNWLVCFDCRSELGTITSICRQADTLPAAACLAVVAVLDSNHPTPGGSDA